MHREGTQCLLAEQKSIMAQDVAELKNVEASENWKRSYMNVPFFLNTSIYGNY